MTVPRPYRAIAYVPDPTGQSLAGRKRVVAGRTSAKTLEGLHRFVEHHTAAGHVVSIETVLDLLDDLEPGVDPTDDGL